MLVRARQPEWLRSIEPLRLGMYPLDVRKTIPRFLTEDHKQQQDRLLRFTVHFDIKGGGLGKGRLYGSC